MIQRRWPVPVTVAVVRKPTVSVYRQGIGANQALYAIPVRAQIDGRLSTVDVVEGQDLCKGEVSAGIDPVVYQRGTTRRLPRRLQTKARLALSNVEFDLVAGSRMPRSSPVSLGRRETRGDPPLAVLWLCEFG